MATQEGNVETKICKYCQSEIPKKAKICPHCRKKQGGGKLPMILGVIALCIIFLSIMMGGGDSNSSSSSTSSGTKSTGETSASTSESASVEDEPSAVSNEGGDTYAGLTAYDVYDILQENEIVPYTLSSKAGVFLKEHDNLFPAEGEINEELVDYGIDRREILKNDTKFGDNLMYLSDLYVSQIEEYEDIMGDGSYFTTINAVDAADNQYYYVLYHGEVTGILGGDYINVYGLPLGRSAFENTTGGQTITIILAGAKVTAVD